MRLIVAIIGLSLLGFAAGFYFVALKAGACIAIGILGIGMTVDALRKNDHAERHEA